MTIYALGIVAPTLGDRVFVAATAAVIGDVELGDDCSVWFGTVIRGDVHSIRIGARTNIQDNSVVHVTTGKYGTTIGEDVTVGHSVVVHACTVGARSLIGIGSILLDGCEIGEECVIGAGTLISPETKIPPRSLVLGRPGRIIREVTDADLGMLKEIRDGYVQNARAFSQMLRPIA